MLRSCKRIWGALPGQLFSHPISMNSLCPSTHTGQILFCSANLTRYWWQSQTNLEFIWKVSRALKLPDCWKQYGYSSLCSCFIFSDACAFVAYISACSTMVWCRRPAMPLPQAPSVYASTSAFIVLGPICVPAKPHLISVMQFTLVTELHSDCLVVCVSWCHPATFNCVWKTKNILLLLLLEIYFSIYDVTLAFEVGLWMFVGSWSSVSDFCYLFVCVTVPRLTLVKG